MGPCHCLLSPTSGERDQPASEVDLVFVVAKVAPSAPSSVFCRRKQDDNIGVSGHKKLRAPISLRALRLVVGLTPSRVTLRVYKICLQLRRSSRLLLLLLLLLLFLPLHLLLLYLLRRLLLLLELMCRLLHLVLLWCLRPPLPHPC